MRTTALSALVLLGASLVASAPIRVVVTTHQEVSSSGHYVGQLPPLPLDGTVASIRLSHLDMIGASHPHLDAQEQHSANGRHFCQSMRAKALEATNRFRAMFGLDPVAIEAIPTPMHALPRPHKHMHDEQHGEEDDFVSILPHPHIVKGVPMSKETLERFNQLANAPILPFVGTPVRPAFAMEEAQVAPGWAGRPAHRFQRFHRHHGSFLRRVHHALVALGPWEGRAVAFVLGCGIGVLLRMMWVMVLLTARAIRGPSGEDTDSDGYDVVFDEAELLVPPPQYTVLAGSEAVPVTDEKEKA
ncbi:hypothetical protein VTO73DRAFT_6465 [Trametes versicolor]